MTKAIRRISKRQEVAERVLDNITFGSDTKFDYTTIIYSNSFINLLSRPLKRVTGNCLWVPDWVSPEKLSKDEKLPYKKEFQQHLPDFMPLADEFHASEVAFREASLAFEKARLNIYLQLMKLVNPSEANKPYELLSEQEEKELELQLAQKKDPK